MAWPTDAIDTEHLDSDADNPTEARPNLLSAAQQANVIRTARDQADGIASTNSASRLPIARFRPLHKGVEASGEELRHTAISGTPPSGFTAVPSGGGTIGVSGNTFSGLEVDDYGHLKSFDVRSVLPANQNISLRRIFPRTGFEWVYSRFFLNDKWMVIRYKKNTARDNAGDYQSVDVGECFLLHKSMLTATNQIDLPTSLPVKRGNTVVPGVVRIIITSGSDAIFQIGAPVSDLPSSLHDRLSNTGFIYPYTSLDDPWFQRRGVHLNDPQISNSSDGTHSNWTALVGSSVTTASFTTSSNSITGFEFGAGSRNSLLRDRINSLFTNLSGGQDFVLRTYSRPYDYTIFDQPYSSASVGFTTTSAAQKVEPTTETKTHYWRISVSRNSSLDETFVGADASVTFNPGIYNANAFNTRAFNVRLLSNALPPTAPLVANDLELEIYEILFEEGD